MATKASTIEYLLDQLNGAGILRAQKMFGEYAIYCDGKVAAFVCDDQLYLKPTDSGRAFFPEAPLAPPHPGAKLYLFIDPDRWEKRDWLCELVRLTVLALPVPKPKKSSLTKKKK